ncbi:hypothetical protein CVV38_03530 [Candidatus Peregrinibacteria bacterium HGW-Peregrinibacteria-1]|jgi:sulfite exporter TauE/SafE/copper chaperone CopZ|nr:MAG: hypothetical protein CVV38_03530 [Candidatus Peregrinibacteria bacterium HGW-Peregrinibacteria-1]
MNNNTFKFHVSGMHCASCKILIEDLVSDLKFVRKTEVDLKGEVVTVEVEGSYSEGDLLKLLGDEINANGYFLSLEKKAMEKGKGESLNNVIWTAIPVGLLLLFLFFLLQKSGILNLGISGEMTPATSLIIGIVASLSSCLAVVGGLVLSLSAKISQDDVSDTKTFLLFHAGRLVSFAVLGGVLGWIGSVVGINVTFAAILGILASLVMLFLGLNLVGVFAKNKITLGSGLFDFFRRIEHRALTPLIIGFATFFLPCGFTQAMQVAAISSGSFMMGGVIMLAFALGTLPVLALLSFGSASFAHSKHAPLFFKSAGVVVIGFAIFAILSALAGLGFIPPIFNI